MPHPAIRLITSKAPRPNPSSLQLQLHCLVKPGVNAKREGIGEITDSHIEVRVAAQAKEGEANKAVREVIAEVLKVPKSDVEIIKGTKSREKTVVVCGIAGVKAGEEEVAIERVRGLLQEGVVDNSI